MNVTRETRTWQSQSSIDSKLETASQHLKLYQTSKISKFQFATELQIELLTLHARLSPRLGPVSDNVSPKRNTHIKQLHLLILLARCQWESAPYYGSTKNCFRMLVLIRILGRFQFPHLDAFWISKSLQFCNCSRIFQLFYTHLAMQVNPSLVP